MSLKALNTGSVIYKSSSLLFFVTLMDYVLEKRRFANEITGASLSKYILTTSKTSIKLMDYKLNLLGMKTYNTNILQAEIVERNGITFVIVLLATCRFEILSFDGIKLILLGLKYFEHSRFNTTEIKLPNSLDVDNFVELYNKGPFFMVFGDYALVLISGQFIAVFNYTQDYQSLIIDVKKELDIRNIINFAHITNFTHPSVLFLCDLYTTKNAYIYSFDSKFYKIKEFTIDDGVYDVEALTNGICFGYRNESNGLLFTTIKNSSLHTKIELPHKINDIKSWGDIAFVFCDQCVYAIDVYFLHDRVKSYNVTKLSIHNSSFGCVSGSHILVGNYSDDSYLYEYSVREQEDQNIDSPESVYTNEKNEKHLELNTKINTDDLFYDIYHDALKETQEKIIKEPKTTLQNVGPTLYDDLWAADIPNQISKITKPKQYNLSLGEHLTIKNYSVKSLCKINSSDYIGLSNDNAVFFTDIVKIQLIRSVKLKGFDRIYNAASLYCLTNSRESIFCKWEEENITVIENSNFCTEEETLIFSVLKEKMLQITRTKLVYDSKIMLENSQFIDAKISNDTLFVLTSTKELLKFDGESIDLFFDGCELFSVLGNYVAIVKSDSLELFENCVLVASLSLYNLYRIQSNTYIDILEVQEIELIHSDSLYILLRTCKALHTLILSSENKVLVIIDTYKHEFGLTDNLLFRVDNYLFLLPDLLFSFNRYEVYIHKINNKLDYVCNNLCMTKGNIVEYCLGQEYDLETYMASKKYKIGDFAFMVDYNSESSTLAIIKDAKIVKDDETINIHTLNLYTLEMELVDTFQFDEHEYVTSIKYMYINENVKPDLLPRKHYNMFLICTLSILKGYDELTKGRIIVFEIKQIASQSGKNTTRKINPLADLRISSNVTACQEVRGNIAVCQGTRLMIYKFDRLDGLTAIAFYDMQILCTSISTLKNYIFVGDILRGTSFFYLQHKPVKIHKISMSENIQNLQHVSLSKIGEYNSVLLLIAFDESHMHIYTYSPNNVLSKNGEYLVKRNIANLNDRVLGVFENSYYTSDTIYMIRKNDIDEAALRVAIKRNKNICMIDRKPLSMVTVKPIVDYNEYIKTDIDF